MQSYGFFSRTSCIRPSPRLLPTSPLHFNFFTRTRHLPASARVPPEGLFRTTSSIPSPLGRSSFSRASPFSRRGLPSVLQKSSRSYSTTSIGSSGSWIVYAIVAINGGVFLLWNRAQTNAEKRKDYTLLKTLYQYFTVNDDTLEKGPRSALILSAFSHSNITHLLVNMLGLVSMGPQMVALLGIKSFLTLYLASGLAGSLLHLSFNKSQNRQRQYANGASGAIYGIFTFFAATFPKTQFLLFFVIPAPAGLLVPGIISWDVWNAYNRPHSSVASMGHVGGAACGMLYFLLRKGRGGFRRF